MDKRTLRKSIADSSQPSKIDEVVSELIDFAFRFKKTDYFSLSLALSEALTNAMIHGNKRDPGKRILVEVSVDSNRLIFRVIDEGAGFDHENLIDPTREENLFKQNGRGIFFIRHFMDEVKFNGLGNEITMIKYV
ncbi:ATP-binding protein [candidate division KSB1 bacterium]|nr:ATP-binding protein [candidate division KSB1 bacterium]NIR71757.1 ATP-binding protein [candidate division KSB1 bacterium]NIS24913.1 ATP-binding protein [candidate division KSB1 bacterium]NIT71789.1 ATP-binding protein [candidate division KSB1 bacterium]NIU25527.1 ATP-binding protein [candidate division KSB1 bacterium]